MKPKSMLKPGTLFGADELAELLAEANSDLPRWGNIFNEQAPIRGQCRFSFTTSTENFIEWKLVFGCWMFQGNWCFYDEARTPRIGGWRTELVRTASRPLEAHIPHLTRLYESQTIPPPPVEWGDNWESRHHWGGLVFVGGRDAKLNV